MPRDIFITHIDKDRIQKALNVILASTSKPDKHTKSLEGEIDRAMVVESQQIPKDVITMNSRVLLQLNDKEIELSLVYPEDADTSASKVSVFSPIGTAILGYKEGDTIEWEVPSGTSTIQIRKIIYQPEAAGDFDR